MKYTFTADNGKEKTVSIPDDYIRTNKKNLGLTTKEVIELWLFDNDYIDNAEADALTQVALANKGAGVKVGGGSKRKAPTRKPDYTKRTLISEIKNSLEGLVLNAESEGYNSIEVSNISIPNVERIVRFQLGDDIYELTLSKKRKPKDC